MIITGVSSIAIQCRRQIPGKKKKTTFTFIISTRVSVIVRITLSISPSNSLVIALWPIGTLLY